MYFYNIEIEKYVFSQRERDYYYKNISIYNLYIEYFTIQCD